MRELFLMVFLFYVVDTRLLEPASIADACSAMFREVVKLLGCDLDAAKSIPMSKRARSLGGVLSIGDGELQWAWTAEKSAQWSEDSRASLCAGRLSREAAGRMWGRLSFAVQRAFRRVGRAAWRPIEWHRRHGSFCSMSRRLVAALEWWLAYLAAALDRTIRGGEHLVAILAWVLYTDAEGEGGVGAVLVHVASRARQHIVSAVPRNVKRALLRRRTQINVFELLAVLMALGSFRAAISGCRVVCFVDNKAALRMLVK